MSRYIVKVSGEHDSILNAIKSMNGSVVKKLKNGFVINVSDKIVKRRVGKKMISLKEDMEKHIKDKFEKNNINVEKIEKDFIVNIDPSENPQKLEANAKGGGGNGGKPGSGPIVYPPQQIPWGITCVEAINLAQTGENISVAIIDTGIDYSHQDLIDNVKGGYNAISMRNRYKHPFDIFYDDNGHGTHVAGTIAALNNSIGVVGIGPKINLYGVKVLDANGSGYISDIIEGIEWSIANNMKVINMSLGSTTYNSMLHDAVKSAKNSGIVVVAAAGNTGNNQYSYPAAFPESISVSAIDQSKNFAYFSTYNDKVDLTAPGVKILSTLPDNTYTEFNGTSMASPHVAGVAALILSKNPLLTNQQVEDIMKNTAVNIGLSSVQQGSGLVSAKNCLNAV